MTYLLFFSLHSNVLADGLIELQVVAQWSDPELRMKIEINLIQQMKLLWPHKIIVPNYYLHKNQCDDPYLR